MPGAALPGVARGLLLGGAMLALLGILALAMVVGKFARRITPAVELALLLLVAALVLAEFVSWSWLGAGSAENLLGRLLTGSR